MIARRIGTREEWAAARAELLAGEKEYRFDTEDGTRTLAELFEGRSQLLVYHFMYGSSYQAGCPTCSSIADSVNGVLPHLNARDMTMIFVSSAPLEKLLSFRKRMGWSFNWASSSESDFNLNLGFSSSDEQTRAWLTPQVQAAMPP